MKRDQEEIKRVVEELGDELKQGKAGFKGAGKSVADLTNEMMLKGNMPKDVLQLSDNQVEGLYAQAYNYYQTGRYKDASQLFRLLILLNTTEMKYIMGLAACLHMMKEYENAAKTYAMCSVLDAETPIPYYHISDCFICMEDQLSAVVALEMAIEKSKDTPQFKVLKERALITLEGLKKELNDKKGK